MHYVGMHSQNRFTKATKVSKFYNKPTLQNCSTFAIFNLGKYIQQVKI
jgi:hypothetical protein